MLVQSLIILLLIGCASAQNANCDYQQIVQPGQVYYVYSPNYPNNYPKGVQCRWAATCPANYNCRLDCNDVAMPQSTSCSLDRLLVSKTGDMQLNGADYYCGTGKFSVVSVGTKLTIGLITATTSPGGRFLCTLTAQSSIPNGTCTCGYKKQNRIVGGVETGVNEYPMMAGLVDLNYKQIKCGAVIIDKRYLVTAAHCTVGKSTANLAVVVGEHDVTTGDSPATRAYALTSITRHPLYTDTNYDYDIAILTTSQDIAFSDRVGPVCLPFKYQATNLTGAKVTILGWGTLSPGGLTSKVLRKVDVDVIDQARCQSMVSSVVTPRQICTYTLGKDACQDDSGGPLLYYDSTTGALFNFGIVSFGQFCATINQPGINTRVPALISWIVANTPGANYCIK